MIDYKAYYDLRDLLTYKSCLERAITTLRNVAAEKRSGIFGRVESVLFALETKGKIEDCYDTEISRAIANHKDELYALIEKICADEEISISKQIDELDKKIERYNLSKEE